MTEARAAFDRLLAEALALANAIPEARDFVADLPRGMAFTAPVPARLPVHERLRGMLDHASDTTRDLARAVAGVIDLAEWRQTYTEAQVGAFHIANYGWFNLISPDGPYLSEAWRVSIGAWGQGVVYPPHKHRPEEIYIVISGGALFRTEGQADARLGPGDMRHHPPDTLHGMVMDDTPLVALALWTGADLMRASTLEDQ